jgi:hypothetical protein
LKESEVRANGADVEHVAELAGLDDVVHLEDRRAVFESMPDHQHQVSLARNLDKFIGLFGRGRQRLLDQHRLARLERAPGHRVVSADRSRDDDTFDIGVIDQVFEAAGGFDVRVQLADVISPLFVEIAGDDPARGPTLIQVAHPVWTPVPETHDADPAQLSALLFGRGSWLVVDDCGRTLVLKRAVELLDFNRAIRMAVCCDSVAISVLS